MTASGPLVLLVEDEPPMRRFLRTALGSRGFRLIEAGTVREAEALVTGHNPDLVLLDLQLPDGDGVELAARLRGWWRGPIVVISARGQETDKVRALDAGADDYLTKPFGIEELLARLRAALRRASPGPASEPVLEAGPIRLDQARHEVTVEGREVRLTPIEFKLLAALLRAGGRVLTHRQIAHDVWGPAAAADPHTVRVHMAALRKRIEADPARPRWLRTEPGVGYRLEAGPVS